LKTLRVVLCANWRTHHVLVAGVTLRQRKWGRANADEEKQIKRTSNKMRFDGGLSLFFHFSSFESFESGDLKRPFYLEARQNVKIIRKKPEKIFELRCCVIEIANTANRRGPKFAQARQSLLRCFERLARFLIENSHRALVGHLGILV
jgi:hypothetical protein